MFGNLLSNTLIQHLIDEKGLHIRPFSKKKLQVAQYALGPLAIRYEREDGTIGICDFRDTKKPYVFQPDEYAVVVVEEHIVLPDGIVGRFIPASGLIERGFGLTAGKLDPGYGAKGEEIRFGLKNLKSKTNEYTYGSPLAYIEFFDIRGLPSASTEVRYYDNFIRQLRRGAELDLRTMDRDDKE